jgi:hypothetical protein
MHRTTEPAGRLTHRSARSGATDPDDSSHTSGRRRPVPVGPPADQHWPRIEWSIVSTDDTARAPLGEADHDRNDARDTRHGPRCEWSTAPEHDVKELGSPYDQVRTEFAQPPPFVHVGVNRVRAR